MVGPCRRTLSHGLHSYANSTLFLFTCASTPCTHARKQVSWLRDTENRSNHGFGPVKVRFLRNICTWSYTSGLGSCLATQSVYKLYNERSRAAVRRLWAVDHRRAAETVQSSTQPTDAECATRSKAETLSSLQLDCQSFNTKKKKLHRPSHECLTASQISRLSQKTEWITHLAGVRCCTVIQMWVDAIESSKLQIH